MNHFVNTAAIILLSCMLSEEGITVESSHRLASKYLLLSFELKCSTKQALIYGFNARSVGLSPNPYCEVVLYDKEMNAISTPSPFRQYSKSVKELHEKMVPGKPIKFVCEADTTKLLYSGHSDRYLTKPRYQDIYFYKLFYHGPLDRPRQAVGNFESQLFSLQR